MCRVCVPGAHTEADGAPSVLNPGHRAEERDAEQEPGARDKAPTGTVMT